MENNNLNENVQEQNTVLTGTVTSDTPSLRERLCLWSVAGLLVSIGMIVLGIVLIQKSDVYLTYASFGGDFYTYAYQGIREIASAMGEIQTAIGWVVVFGGALAGCAFGRRILKK